MNHSHEAIQESVHDESWVEILKGETGTIVGGEASCEDSLRIVSGFNSGLKLTQLSVLTDLLQFGDLEPPLNMTELSSSTEENMGAATCPP